MPVPAPRGYLVNPYKQGDTMTESSDYESVQVFIGVDVGKDPHHAVARSEGVLVGYLPGLAMRRITDLYSGEAKTDARDAAIIAEANA